ncbi:RNA-binding S4 domain-containing protein [Crocinitomicaceae bacterium CZZ-1]|uniref:RNA-binding S4 domain-containing protein n=1 Tax=Taishania pollutisoli TaxID=2766479 RepID=A0A8J6TSH2_9FLAO|nr:RNA-binding S4 domain-containing protein [Taishania pollutisoli]MBC9811274.1 RNA-binding S4 domain-containing protein [Taishania pollutisoli]MBX2947811.1 RNA-binding S4 domain-containing protein [Crocinitomicaceae bacterium]NGF75057.1 RNA-binding S4 domain-containing protein [Fluviicola sp. SGL-29]
MSSRIDKYLWCVRLSKTRSIATELISKGKVKLNGELIKPSREVKPGDIISIQKNTATFSYKIVQLLPNRVGAKLVTDYLEDITDPVEIEKYKAYQLAQSSYREFGSGKPSKKDRRDISDFLEDW